MKSPASTEYAFPRNDRGRMDCLQIFLDPITQRQLRSLNITPGLRCWELGAGGGSIAAHLADLVGPTGLVVATDRNTSQLGHLTSRVNVHVHTQDARELTVPTPRRFDLFTTRLTQASNLVELYRSLGGGLADEPLHVEASNGEIDTSGAP